MYKKIVLSLDLKISDISSRVHPSKQILRYSMRKLKVRDEKKNFKYLINYVHFRIVQTCQS